VLADEIGEVRVEPVCVGRKGGHSPATVVGEAPRATPECAFASSVYALLASIVMSTRRLIIAALVCGVAILVAFAVQLALVL
jgi:hypothetical protein